MPPSRGRAVFRRRSPSRPPRPSTRRTQAHHARGVPAVKAGQGFADFGAAAGALRHDRETVERARGILFLHCVGNISEPRMKEKRLGFTKFIEHAMDES